MNRTQAIAIIRHTEEHNGGTFYPFGVDAKLSGGYVVGGVVKPLETDWRQSDTELARKIQAFVKAAAPAFKANPLRYVGTWVEGDTLYLDVSEVVYSKYQAVLLGLSRNELAIYDVTKNKSIDLLPYRKALCELVAD